MARSMWALLALALAGCEHPAVSRFEIHVRAHANGEPMAGMRVSEGGVVLGQTDEDGAVVLVTERAEGATIGLVAACPNGYRARPERVTRTLRTWQRTEEEGEVVVPPLEIDVECDRHMSDVVLVVDAGREGFPLLVDGAVVERTDEVGLAHVLVHGPPGRRLRISIDTSSQPNLVPESPEWGFTIEDDDVVYWQRSFEVEGSRGRGRGRRNVQEPDIPERIE